MEYAVVWKVNTCPGIPFFAYCLTPSAFSIARSSEEYHFKKKYITYLCSSFGKTLRKCFHFGEQSGLAVPAGKNRHRHAVTGKQEDPPGRQGMLSKKAGKSQIL